MNVLYFAWVRERIGLPRERIETSAATVRELVEELRAREERYAVAFADTTALRVAVDQELTNFDAPLDGASEVAFFPPMTGGQGMRIVVQEAPFDLGAEANAFASGHTDMGAIVTFTGVVRDSGEDALNAMEIEHYPGMTERALTTIAEEAASRWSLGDVLVIHRYGRLVPGETIMMVATASRHRKDAFEAAEFLMDYLKSRAPFWKREVTEDGASSWVAARAEDEEALDRWQFAALWAGVPSLARRAPIEAVSRIVTTAIVKGGKFLFIVQSIFRVLPINPYVAAFSGLLAGLFTERAYVLLENLVNKAASGIGKEALGENDTEAPTPVTETVEEAEPATSNGAPTEIKTTHAASKPAKGNGATNGKKPAPAS